METKHALRASGSTVMHLQPSLSGGGCEEMEPWSGCAWLQIMYTASEICISAQTGRLNADQGDMHGVGVPTLKQYSKAWALPS